MVLTMGPSLFLTTVLRTAAVNLVSGYHEFEGTVVFDVPGRSITIKGVARVATKQLGEAREYGFPRSHISKTIEDWEI
jgi:hypothetical protein